MGTPTIYEVSAIRKGDTDNFVYKYHVVASNAPEAMKRLNQARLVGGLTKAVSAKRERNVAWYKRVEV